MPSALPTAPATSTRWRSTLTTGSHALKIEYYDSGGGAVAKFSFAETPAQSGGGSSSGTELLSAPWHLSAQSNAVELYQGMSPTVLQGKTSLRITYDLHGLDALGNDASAIIIDQNGWQYVSLSDYGQNGLSGVQTVEIPLADFGNLDVSQPVGGTIHTRFWYGSPYTVDITSIVVY